LILGCREKALGLQPFASTAVPFEVQPLWRLGFGFSLVFRGAHLALEWPEGLHLERQRAASQSLKGGGMARQDIFAR